MVEKTKIPSHRNSLFSAWKKLHALLAGIIRQILTLEKRMNFTSLSGMTLSPGTISLTTFFISIKKTGMI
jgi:hypothetical protein